MYNCTQRRFCRPCILISERTLIPTYLPSTVYASRQIGLETKGTFWCIWKEVGTRTRKDAFIANTVLDSSSRHSVYKQMPMVVTRKYIGCLWLRYRKTCPIFKWTDNNQQTTTKCYFPSQTNMFVLNDRINIEEEYYNLLRFRTANLDYAILLLNGLISLSTGYGEEKFPCYAFAHLRFLNVSVPY